MAGFFSRVPKFKIRSGGDVGEKEAIPSQPPVPCESSIPAATVSLVPEVAMDISSTVPSMLEVVMDTSFALSLKEHLLPPENVRRPDKEKRVINDGGENAKKFHGG
ncbi:hypothetical protein Fot_26215 [Forsythia ovata]|uniref:Uncharacterized protein n=1 Tax=Forsythia ovata TaxID=205694 RepID=A0ABD1T8U1_9LAMI